MMRRCFTLLVSVLLALVLAPRSAHADQSTAHSVSVAVLSFDSEDAEEQAEALTGALRSRIRASQAWSLIDAAQPLGMLTAALRCPGKPLPADCQLKVSEQIKAERFIFGYVTKGPQAGQVTAEIHLYQRGKAEVVIKEGYADNLKDQNDDTLRKIAQRALDRLGGSAVGVVVVRTSEKEGEVIVDGTKRVPLKDGTARLELAAGGHSVEVSIAGGTQKRNVLVQPGKETVVEMVSATPVASSPSSEDKPFPTRKVVGFTALGLAIAGGVVSVIHTGQYLDAQSEANDRATEFQAKLPPGKQAGDVCDSAVYSPEEVCKVQNRSERASKIAWISGGIGGAFLLTSGVLLLTDWFSGDKSPSREKAAAKGPKARLVPAFGTTSSSLLLTGTF